jgi:hypothetical protein
MTKIDIKGVATDMTEAEEAQFAIDKARAVTDKAEAIEAATQLATDKANANQKLLDLGLTQAEVDAFKK